VSERLKIDLDGLGALVSSMHGALKKLEDERGRNELVVFAVGHPALKDRVGSFESRWNDRRRDIFESVDRLNVILRDTTLAFEALETDLEKALQAPPPSTSRRETANVPGNRVIV
jgi:hypothetical protein